MTIQKSGPPGAVTTRRLILANRSCLPTPWVSNEIYQVYLKIRGKVKPEYRDLIDPQHPALQNILKVSGLLKHSFLVGDGGASVADKLERDADLVRVAGYFHDYGKLRLPAFFAGAMTGIRTGARPIRSFTELRLILDHPQAGVEDLIEFTNIPPAVLPLILQHHGSMMTMAKYDRAVLGDLTPAELSYPNLKPQTVEAAIIMLGDEIETALSILHNKKEMPPSERLARSWLMEKVLVSYRKLASLGQFAECGQRLQLTWKRDHQDYTGPEMERAAEFFMWEFWKFYTGKDTQNTPNGFVKHGR